MASLNLSRRALLRHVPLIAAAAVPLPALALTPEPEPELTGVDALRKPAWDMALALYNFEQAHWQVSIAPEKGFAFFVRRSDLSGRGIHFTDLQP